MSPSDDRFVRLVELLDDFEPLAFSVGWQIHLRAICATARTALGAPAVSIAMIATEPGSTVGEEGLLFVAADGATRERIEGVWMAAGRGLAGFVAGTSQALAVDSVQSDPRFATEVADAVGYVPNSMLVAPIDGQDGTTIGVLSVLDRDPQASPTSVDAMALAGAFCRQAALILPRIDIVERLGPLVVRALAEAAEHSDDDLAAGLRSVAGRVARPDGDLARIAALLADLRDRGPDVRRSAERILEELLALTAPKRRR